MPSVVGHAAVGGEFHGQRGAGGGETCIAIHGAQQAVVQLCAACAGSVINGDIVAAAFAISRQKGDGDMSPATCSEGVDVALTVAVAAVRAARIVEADGLAIGNGGGGVGDVDRTGAVGVAGGRRGRSDAQCGGRPGADVALSVNDNVLPC